MTDHEGRSKMSDVAQAMVKALQIENQRLRTALEEIRDIAAISEGVEFYAMLAERALKDAQS
tara:strand:- start:632 stop:817 length:186 start_codon:yes stop_codon:yes gene_type:complete